MDNQKKHLTIQKLFSLISGGGNSSTLLVGIDGCGGSGKSTLAEIFKKNRSDVQIVHMDEFYLPSIERSKLQDSEDIEVNIDWQRMTKQVLNPLSKGETATYQIYDWEKDLLTNWLTIENRGMVLVEGVMALRNEIKGYYNYKIWVDCPYDERLKRGILRDGEEMRATWQNEWMPSENNYIEKHKPELSADIILDGSSKNDWNEGLFIKL